MGHLDGFMLRTTGDLKFHKRGLFLFMELSGRGAGVRFTVSTTCFGCESVNIRTYTWRGGRAAECGGLENRLASIPGYRGSNPRLSASYKKRPALGAFIIWIDL